MHPLKEFYEPCSFIYMQNEQACDFLNCLPTDVMPPARIVELYVNLSTVQTYVPLHTVMFSSQLLSTEM